MRFIESRLVKLFMLVVLGCTIVSGAASARETTADWPAHARCEAVRIGNTIFVWGTAVAVGPAIDTILLCHVYADGSWVGVVPGVGVGPTSHVVGAIQDGPIGPVTTCAEAHVTYTDGAWHKHC